MSIEYINSNLPPSEKIERINRQTIELAGKESEGRFDKHEIDNIYDQICIDRKFKRRVNIGSELATYTNWTHFYEQTGYSIWKCAVVDFADNLLNELYFSDEGEPVDNVGALCEYKGEAATEAAVPALLAMTASEILARDWKWCYYNGSVYITIRNSGNENYEGDYYLTWQSTDTFKRNFFVYNHQIISNYEDSTYVYTYVCAANELMVTDAGEVDGYGNPYVAYTAGRVLIYATIYEFLSGELLLELGTINYVFVNSSGVVTTNTTGWPDVFVPLAIVVCDSSGIVSITNKRVTLDTGYEPGSRLGVISVIADYTALSTDVIILCGAGNETFTVYLPVPVNEKVYYVKNIGTGVITVNANTVGGATIDGGNTAILNQNDCVQVVSDGTVYWVI